MFSRHDLVWLTGDGWDGARDRALPGHHAAIEQWRREDWPAIVRRADPGLAAGQLSLGIALPPAPNGAKGRIAFNIDKSDVARTSPALALSAAAEAAPATWRAAVNALSTRLPLRAYGSLAMQAITGQRYLTASSDIDLLFLPSDGATLRNGLVLLAQFAEILPLDGEIVFPSGDAVAWKEWINAGVAKARVLVKDAATVRLAQPASLLTTLEPA